MIFPLLTNRPLRAGLMLVMAVGFIGVLSASAPLPTPVPEDLLPELKVILQDALKQSPAMMLKNIELTQSEMGRQNAIAQLYPSIGLGGGYNVSMAAISNNSAANSRATGLSYSAAINQPLFRWGTLKAQVDSAKIQLSITQKNYAEAYRLLALSLRSQYLSLMARKLALRNAQFGQQQAAASLALEEDKLKNGRISQGDIIAPRLQLEESVLACERAAEDLAAAKRYFLRQAGRAEMSDESIPTEIPAVTFAPETSAAMLKDFLGHDWENNIALQVSRDWIKVADANYKQAKYRLYPMFGFGAGITQSNSTSASANSVSQTGVLSQSFGLTMSWSIFDGFATRAAKISAMANKRYYERQFQMQSDTIMDQARSLEKQVGFSYRALHLIEIRAGLGASSVQMREDEAKIGVTSRDVVEATRAGYYQLQQALLVQRADFLSRWTEYISLLGHDPILQQFPANIKSNVH